MCRHWYVDSIKGDELDENSLCYIKVTPEEKKKMEKKQNQENPKEESTEESSEENPVLNI